jgi:hypothetical protein
MPFLTAIRRSLPAYPPGTPERIILDFLLANGIGRANAKPWSTIEAELRRHGFVWRLQQFQQGLLKDSREGDMYIGSNDHAPYKGYFIIADQDDATLMAEWYQKRIATEQARLNNLNALIAAEWP